MNRKSAFLIAVFVLILSGSIRAEPAPRGPVAGKDARQPAISADGRYVVFASPAADLVLGDTNYAIDIFLYDRETRQTSLVSRRADGAQSGYDSVDPAISADGRFIAFVGGSGLLPDPQEWGVVVYDRQTGQFTLVSRNSEGEPANDTVGRPSISADGRYVAFHSSADNLVPDDTQLCNGGSRSCYDIFVHDRETGETTMISRNANGAGGDDGSYGPHISGDGRFVVFGSDARNLLEGNPEGPTTTNGLTHVYVYDRQAGEMALVSRNTAGEQANHGAGGGTISDDGRLVVFNSLSTNLASVESDTVNAFIHNRETGETMLVSRNAAGAPANASAAGSVLSADGLVVAYVSPATNLVEGSAGDSVDDIFAHDLETGQTTLITRPPAGGTADRSSWGLDLSGDGRFVVFETLATNLGGPVVIDDRIDIALHDRATGRTSILTARPPTLQGNSESRTASVSADGRFVAFESYASNLVPNDTNGLWDIFLYDVHTSLTTLIGRGGPATGNSRWPVISADGRSVAFASFANVYQDRNIFVYDVDTGATTLVSRTPDGLTPDGGISDNASLSPDGRYVAFDSDADDLVASDTNEERDLFLHDRQTGETTMLPYAFTDGVPDWSAPCCAAFSPDGRYVTFVAWVPPELRLGWFPMPNRQIFVHDRQTGETTPVPFGPSGAGYDRHAGSPSISADGRTVAYHSDVHDLVADDTNTTFDVFVYDRQAGTQTLISRRSDGQQGNGPSYDPSISADGRYVSFVSDATNLVAGDGNGAPDVFLHDRQTGQTTLVSRGANGASIPGGSFEPALAAGGERVAFWSDAALVAGDVNGLYDVFLYDRAVGSIRLVSGIVLPGPHRFHAPVVIR